VDNNGQLIIQEIGDVWISDNTNELLELEFEDGTIIKCTHNHKFKLKNGEIKRAVDLNEYDELMSYSIVN
jgi:intein/homing endonuclease